MTANNELEGSGYIRIKSIINPLNAELNPIRHLLTLLGAHHILHIGRVRVNVSGQKKREDRTNFGQYRCEDAIRGLSEYKSYNLVSVNCFSKRTNN
jgi:hypothetical protein